MARLSYVGTPAADDNDIISRSTAEEILDAGDVTRPQVAEDIAAAVALRASKTYIDQADSLYATVSYYQTQDSARLPLSAIGQQDGAAALISGEVPAEQIPAGGAGYLRGPFGATTRWTVTNVTDTPTRIAEFRIGVPSVAFRPLIYGVLVVDTEPGGQPVVEARISNGEALYSSQTLIGQGAGRALHSGRQSVLLTPASDTLGAAGTGTYAADMDVYVAIYVYSSSPSVPVAVSSTGVASAALYLMRTEE